MSGLTLSPRLLAVSRMVRRSSRVADVGTDHAFVPAYLVKNGISDFVIASDIAKGPLEKAKETVAAHGLGDKIETRLSNGLCAYSDGEVDDVIIAGMGGDTMLSIIDASPWVCRRGIRLILQPMTMQARLRRSLLCRGFYIVDEDLCQEGHHIDQIIVLEYDGERRDIDEAVSEVGPLIFEKRAEYGGLFLAHLEQKIKGYDAVIMGGTIRGRDVTKEKSVRTALSNMRIKEV